MPNRYYSLIVLVILSFASCKSHNNYVSMIHGKSIKYWDIADDSRAIIRYCYSFSEDGRCTYYYYNGIENCRRVKFDDDDVSIENTWEIKGDSVIRFRSQDRKILIINADTILTSLNNHVSLLLKSKIQNNNIFSCDSLKSFSPLLVAAYSGTAEARSLTRRQSKDY